MGVQIIVRLEAKAKSSTTCAQVLRLIANMLNKCWCDLLLQPAVLKEELLFVSVEDRKLTSHTFLLTMPNQKCLLILSNAFLILPYLPFISAESCQSLLCLVWLTYMFVCVYVSQFCVPKITSVWRYAVWKHDLTQAWKELRLPAWTSLSYFSDKVFPVHYVYPCGKCDWIFGNISYKYWGYVRLGLPVVVSGVSLQLYNINDLTFNTFSFRIFLN